MPLQTPGVFINEHNAFASGVVEVATAVPAFIGHTERAAHGGRDLRLRPWRISSMADYESCFGGMAAPQFTPAAAGPGTGQRLQARHRHLLHPALRHFFMNGGGACYVVSVGDHAAAPSLHSLASGLAPLAAEQEPTLLVVPDAVLLPQADCAALQAAMLRHCGEQQRCFAILDVWGGDRPRHGAAGDAIAQFRQGLGSAHLQHGAAYYPWLHTAVLQARDLAPWRQGPLAGHEDAALAQLNLLPPAAAMAGVYTLVDHSRGVWKAPANVGLAGVLRPAVDIGPAEQDDLTNSLDGKSVNAIRSFVGQGVLVWGARTLAGNSQDWRYVNVRRSVAMLAQSCRLALQALVFEPNDAGTWATARAMLTSFLTAVWQRGGLAGAQAQDAFSVQLGLGETMSAQDLLDGVLRVTLLLAVSRPAEFIEISFQQQMQKA